MRFICLTNDGQISMLKNMLNSASKCGLAMNDFHVYMLPESYKASAKYGSQKFRDITVIKLKVILENLRRCDEIMWVDNDIVFFENCVENMRSYPGDFIMQNDGWSPCTGFFLARRNEKTLRVIELSIAHLQKHTAYTTYNDQSAFNDVYKSVLGIDVKLLPDAEYPNGSVYFDKGQKAAARMVHNNYLQTTPEKIYRFHANKLWDDSSAAFDLVNKYNSLDGVF